MFRSRGRKIFRDIWARKGRTALASLAIFVGVLGVVVLVSGGDLIMRQLDKDLQEDHMSMQVVFVTMPGGVEVDNAACLETLQGFPGVTRVEGRAVYPLFWKLPADDKFEDGFIQANWEPFEEIELEPMRLTAQGRYPVAGKKEIAIEKRMADKYELGVGDQLVLRILSGAAGGGGTVQDVREPQSNEESWTIVGVVLQPYPSFLGADSETSVFATYEDAQYIAGFTGFNDFHIRYTDFATAEDKNDNFIEVMARETPYVPMFSFIDDPAQSFLITQVGQVVDLLSTLGLVAMVVSGFLVINIINTIVVEQRRQIGVMKSMGATRWDNFMMYTGIALTYGLIGLVPGVLLGVPLGSLMAQVTGSLANTLVEGFNVSTRGVLMGAVMGLAVPLAAAILPVFFGTRVSILEAMTDVGISVDYGRGLLARVINKLPIPINVRQALSNVTRKKARLMLTGLTLTMAIASFMGIFGLFFSMNEIITGVFDAFGFQIVVAPSEGQDFEEVQALILEGVEGVGAVYPGFSASVELEGYVEQQFGTGQLPVTGFDPRTDTLDLDLEAGTAWQDDPERTGIVLTSGVAEQLGKGAGDQVVLAAGGQSAALEIIGISSFPFDQGFMEWRALARMAGFTVGGEPAPNAFLVQMENPDPTIDQVDEVIDQISEALLAGGITAGYTNQLQDIQEITQVLMMFGMMFSLAAMVMAAVGAIGLLATLSMSVFERQKEIGVMRSIGAGSATIAGQFLVEGILIGVLAWIVGAPLSYLLNRGLVAGTPFGADVAYPPISLLIGLVGILVIATISSLGPSISAARKTVSQIIRYQ